MSLKKSIYEHLITKKKYNTLKVKFEALEDELERKILELNTQKIIHVKKQTIWEQTLKHQEEEIIKLKKRKAKKNER